MRVALVDVTRVSGSVVTTGTAGVAKVSTLPNVVPSEFWPIAQQESLHQLAIGCHQGAQGAAVILRINALFTNPDLRRQAQSFYDALLRPQDLKRLRALMPPEPASGPGRQRP